MPKKILIVDDAMFMRTMLRNILLVEGYSVCEAENGEKALEAYNTYTPDLVLMDVTMPVMDGITAIKHLVKDHPAVRVIVCSAMGQQGMVLEAIKSGAKDFIVKPFDAARVIAGIKKQLAA